MSVIGTALGAISLILTFIVSRNTGKIKEKVGLLQNIDLLRAEKETIKNDLLSTLDIINMGDKSQTSFNQLHTIIRKLEEYKGLMSKPDLENLKNLKNLLRQEHTYKNIEEINASASEIVGFLDLKIDETIKIM
ncbi:hypothetical protein [Lysinibacillus sp.]|uniref:hypothetical protein n=1 Tax=Lysinibacillus sp. TaxID=1869345 RepID=UPI00289F1F1B|nr:hypothetical protein [Lysinibacillus sp.]